MVAAMRREAVAVIDVGKSRVKVVAVDRDGAVLQSSSAASGAANGALKTEAAWTWALAALAHLAGDFAVTAIVPATHGAAAAVIGERGLLHPIVDYEAPLPADVDAAYDAVRPPFAETHSPRLPGGLNLGRQLYAMRHADRRAWSGARMVLTYPQYWSWRLTGNAASEVTSLGCHTDLWAPRGGTFSSLVAREGWSALFPPLASAWQSLGVPRRELGLGFEAPVLNGIHDSNAAFLRYVAAVPAPFALLSTGTWMIAFNAGGDIAALDPARDTLANVDVLGRPIACSRFMGGREYAAIAGAEGLAVAPTAVDLKAVIARRIFALPSFTDSGGPHPGARGRLTARPASAIEAAALAALYCALMSRDLLALTGPATRLYVDGPFAANEAYVTALAALLPGVEVRTARETEGTAIGASLLARMHEQGGRVPEIAIASRRIDPPDVDVRSYADEWGALVARSEAEPRVARTGVDSGRARRAP
jgi:sugar (pentulose or hexulose) kinase